MQKANLVSKQSKPMLSSYTYDDFIKDPYSVQPENFLEIVSKIKKDDHKKIKSKIFSKTYETSDCPILLQTIVSEAETFYENERIAAENRISNTDPNELLEDKQLIPNAEFFSSNGPDNTYLLHFKYPLNYEKKSFTEDYEDFRIGEMVILRQRIHATWNIQFYGKIYRLNANNFIIMVNFDQIQSFLPLIIQPKFIPRHLIPHNIFEKGYYKRSFTPDIIIMPKRNLLDSYLVLRKNVSGCLDTGEVINKPLIDFILSSKITSPSINYIPEIEFFDRDLNNYQKRAVINAIAAPLFYQIDGPPGTGKTRVQCEIILQLAKRGQKVLVATPSPAALENIIDRVVAAKKVVACHLGIKEKELVKGEIHIENLCESNKRIKDAANSTQNMLELIKDPSTSIEEQEYLEGKLRELKDYQIKCVAGLIKIVLEVSEVIFATLPDITDPHMEKRNLLFDVCIIDECSQAVELASWIPLIRSKKLVISGDECQLAPLVFSQANKEQQLHVSLFSRMKRKIPEIAVGDKKIKDPSLYELLRIQYRMNADIAEWSNGMFYGGQLKSDDACAQITLDEFSKNPGEHAPKLIYINTDGKAYFEENGPSKVNFYEAAYVLEVIKYLENKYNLEASKIGVITPYKAQAELIGSIFKTSPRLQGIKCWTIDAFQGKEKDIIILSMVRSNNQKQIGFINDVNRLNVSVTRAKRLLVVIGNHYTMSGDPNLKTLTTHLSKRGKNYSDHSLFKNIPHDVLTFVQNMHHNKNISVSKLKKIVPNSLRPFLDINDDDDSSSYSNISIKEEQKLIEEPKEPENKNWSANLPQRKKAQEKPSQPVQKYGKHVNNSNQINKPSIYSTENTLTTSIRKSSHPDENNSKQQKNRKSSNQYHSNEKNFKHYSEKSESTNASSHVSPQVTPMKDLKKREEKFSLYEEEKEPKPSKPSQKSLGSDFPSLLDSEIPQIQNNEEWKIVSKPKTTVKPLSSVSTKPASGSSKNITHVSKISTNTLVNYENIFSAPVKTTDKASLLTQSAKDQQNIKKTEPCKIPSVDFPVLTGQSDNISETEEKTSNQWKLNSKIMVKKEVKKVINSEPKSKIEINTKDIHSFPALC